MPVQLFVAGYDAVQFCGAVVDGLDGFVVGFSVDEPFAGFFAVIALCSVFFGVVVYGGLGFGLCIAGFAHVGALDLVEEGFEFFAKTELEDCPGEYVLEIAERIGYRDDVFFEDCNFQLLKLFCQQGDTQLAAVF